MPDKFELRGIISDYSDGQLRRQLYVRDSIHGIYHRYVFPNDRPYNRGQILKFLSEQLNVSPEDIVWPAHITIP